MPSHEENGADFISIVVADSTRIHTQLLADAMRTDHGLQVVASASSSEELLAAVVRVPIDVAVISYSLDDQPGRGTEVLREIRTLRPQIKGVLLLDSSRPQDVLEAFRAGAKGIFASTNGWRVSASAFAAFMRDRSGRAVSNWNTFSKRSLTRRSSGRLITKD